MIRGGGEKASGHPEAIDWSREVLVPPRPPQRGKNIDWNDLGHFNEKSSGIRIHKYVGAAARR